MTRHLYREEVDGPRIQERPSRHIYKKSESTPLQGEQVLTHTGRKTEVSRIRGKVLSRHVYTEENESTLIQGDATRHLYRKTTRPNPLLNYLDTLYIQGKRSYAYTGRHLRTLSMTSFLVSRHLYRVKR